MVRRAGRTINSIGMSALSAYLPYFIGGIIIWWFLLRRKSSDTYLVDTSFDIEQSNPVSNQNVNSSIGGTVVKSISKDAKEIYEAFGINWFLGIPAPFEREDIIVQILRSYNKSQYRLLSEEYLKLYNRILKDDLFRYLKASDLDQIKHVL